MIFEAASGQHKHPGPAIAYHDRRVSGTGTCSTVQASHPAGVMNHPQDLTPTERAHLVALQPKTGGAIFEANPTAAALAEAWYVVSRSQTTRSLFARQTARR